MTRAIFSLLTVLVLANIVSVLGQKVKTINEADSDWREGIASTIEECKYLMSEETASYLEDDYEYDNNEVRDFLGCLYTKLGYMKDCKMVADTIHNDVNIYFDGVDSETCDAVHDAVDFCCKHEVDEHDSCPDAAGKFTNCLNRKKKNDVEK
ncbi:uncharacterized protein [Chelonus insularis]|uniref:uncharacterized protein n=1 Tax=Chelonus insularis TaxID=460826 RepID=UPI00158BA454|nr:uncharacterized protein LOC118064815 [Chelonus insularis]